MSHSPPLLLLMIAASFYVAKLWRDDLRAMRTGGRSDPHALPGATPASARAIAIAIAGALAILIAETWGEAALGLTHQQSSVTALFGLYTLVAPAVEELIFRGYLTVEKRGRAALWLGAIGASVLFAALHPFLWRWEENGFEWTFGAKGWFSTGAVFAMSLWLYVARFAPWNPTRSLLPCFTAHAVKNVGVLAIKAGLGFVSGWW